MQVLLCLAEQPGQVIPKQRLIQRVWPDTFVSDDVLTRSISELRRAFGDDAREPRFIQTIPRGGYRLIARVFSTDAERGIAAPEQPAISEPLDESRPRSLIAPVNGGSAASGLGITAAPDEANHLSCVPGSPSPSSHRSCWRFWCGHWYILRGARRSLTKLTGNSLENSVTSMAISPDGRHLAYADNTGIFLKLIHTGEIHPVALPPHFGRGRPVSGRIPLCSSSRAEQPGKALAEYLGVRRRAPSTGG